MASRKAFTVSRPILGALATGAIGYAAYRQSSSFLPVAAEGVAAPTKTNHDTKRLRFELPDEEAVSGISVISALLTKATTEGSWFPTLRPYSPISHPDEPGHVDLLVKCYPKGSMSNHIHSLTPGSTLAFMKKPLTEYAWTPNKHAQVVLIAGGAGITPLHQLTHSIFRNPAETTKVTLVFGVNTDQDLLFKREFDALARQYPERFRVVYTGTSPGGLSSTERKGRVTQELLKEVLPGPETENLKIFFCGPPAMEEAVVGKKGFGPVSQGKLGGVVAALGYRQEQVHKL